MTLKATLPATPWEKRADFCTDCSDCTDEKDDRFDPPFRIPLADERYCKVCSHGRSVHGRRLRWAIR